MDTILEEHSPLLSKGGVDIPMPSGPTTIPTTSVPIGVTSVEETTYDESMWHIAQLLKTSANACFALQAITRKKCTARIVQGCCNPSF